MAGTLVIKLTAEPENITPERAGRDAAPGFAADVKQIKRQAEGGWGWCVAVVSAEYRQGDQIVSGTAILGTCSYHNAADFVCNSGYFDDMVAEAIADLKDKLMASGIVPIQNDYAALARELADIITAYCPGHLGKIATSQLAKTLKRPELLGKAARKAWDSCMRTPEILAALPADKHQRAQVIIAKLQEIT